MEKKFYVVKAEKPNAHYIIPMTTEELNGAKTFLNGISNPEYAIGHSGTGFCIYEIEYDTIDEAENFLSTLLFKEDNIRKLNFMITIFYFYVN